MKIINSIKCTIIFLELILFTILDIIVMKIFFAQEVKTSIGGENYIIEYDGNELNEINTSFEILRKQINNIKDKCIKALLDFIEKLYTDL